MANDNFSTYHITTGDAYSREEREEIARNIIAFVECAWCETCVNHFGTMVVKRERLTIEQMRWLGVVHDDVLGKIEHN